MFTMRRRAASFQFFPQDLRSTARTFGYSA